MSVEAGWNDQEWLGWIASWSQSGQTAVAWTCPFMDVVKEDMKSVGVKEEDAEDRVGWRQTIGCGHSRRKQEEKKKKTQAAMV